mgnify:CR=1 FL=1
MRNYIDATELITGMGEAERIRADVTGKTDTEVQEIITLVREVMSGRNYRLTKHLCGHNEDKSCVVEKI